MIGRAFTLAILLFAVSSISSAQRAETRERAIVFGITGSGFIGPYAHETILGLGLLAGLDQRLSNAISIRALATLQRGVSTSDGVGVCRPAPADGCLPRPLLPHWLSTIEVNVVFAPVPRLPVRIVGGVGYSMASDARETWKGSRRVPAPIETPLVIRRGIEIPLGSSPRAVRLQYTRSDFRPEPFSLSRVDAVALLIRP